MYKELRKLLYGEQINQQELAERLDRSASYVSQRMTGKKPWNTNDIYTICDLFHIAYSEISVYFPKGGRTATADKAG